VAKNVEFKRLERGFCDKQNPFARIWGDMMNYMTIIEASQKWNISPRRIQTLCSTGRIPGVERLGYCWAIPKDAQKPVDARVKSGKYIRKNQDVSNEAV